MKKRKKKERKDKFNQKLKKVKNTLKKSLVLNFILGFIIILFIIGIFFFRLTGKSILDITPDIDSHYNLGEKINGTIMMQIAPGDFIINDTVIIINIELSKEGIMVYNKNITFEEFLNGELIPVQIFNETTNTTNFYFNETGTYTRNISDFVDYNFNEIGEYKIIISIPTLGIIEERVINVESDNLSLNNSELNNESDKENPEEKSYGVMDLSPGAISTCGNISQSGTYTLSGDVSSNGNCFNISADNVTLDGNSKWINGSVSIILISGVRNNITIKNTRMYSNDSSINGIKFDSNSSSITIFNNIINLTYSFSNVIDINFNGKNLTSINVTNNIIYAYYPFWGRSINGYFFNNTCSGNNYLMIDSVNDTYINNDFGFGFRFSPVTGSSFIDQIINNSYYYFFGNFSIINSSAGKINFFNVNNQYGGNVYKNSSSIVQIRNNYVYINSSAVNGGFNVSANVTLYNLPTNLTSPTILRNGVVCPSSICSLYMSLNSGNVTFNVNSWSNYSIAEGPLIPGNIYNCGNITQSGTYTLSSNVSSNGTCFTISADNVVLDGNNHNITFGISGSDNIYGIFLSGIRVNVSIINTNISQDKTGVQESGIFSDVSTTGCLFMDNTINLDNNINAGSCQLNSNSRGINLNNSDSDVIYKNNISACFGIFIASGSFYNNINISYNNINGPGSALRINGNNGYIAYNKLNASSMAFRTTQSNNTFLYKNEIYDGSISIRSYYFSIYNFTNNSLIEYIDADVSSLQNYFFTDQKVNIYYFWMNSGATFIDSNYGKISLFNINGTGTNLYGNSSSNIQIGNNLVYVNSSDYYIDSYNFRHFNKSANITLYNLPTNFTNPKIFRDGLYECDSTTVPACSNFTSLNSGNVSFNVSSWSSNYSIMETIATASNNESMTLNSGWNLVSFGSNINSTGDKNISVHSGWNLIGYSGNNSILVDNINFTNITTRTSFSRAYINGQIRPYFTYFDSSPSLSVNRKFKFSTVSSTRIDTSYLNKTKGYFLYSNVAGNLTIYNVTGAIGNETFNYSSLKVTNGSMQLNLSEAGNATYNWINSTMYYYGCDSRFFYNNCGTEGAIYEFLRVPDYKTNISSYEGVFVYSNKDNITLIR